MNESLNMQRALDLASLGIGKVSPNPMVGCVIVHDNMIIGEGYHKKYGEPHAEVNAINSVNNKSLLCESTIFVTLEPCAHFGNTPPCADLLIEHKVAKVVICNRDPFNQVNGKGIEKLLDAGIAVEIGLLSQNGEELNKHFFTSIKEGRPYIILKWAETADGFVAQQDGKPISISNKYCQVINHKWRSEVDAIMVGGQTVENDNPSLTTRLWEGKNPKRVILDRNLTTLKKNKVLDNTSDTIVFNQKESKTIDKTEWIQIDFDGKDFIHEITDHLNMRKIRSLIIEGGPRLHQLFVEKDCFDELRIIKSSKLQRVGLKAIPIPQHLKTLKKEQMAEDEILTFSK